LWRWCALYFLVCLKKHYNGFLCCTGKVNHLPLQRLWVRDLKKENTKVSSFTYPVSIGVENRSSFAPHNTDWKRAPSRKWLVQTGVEAHGLVDQRSNVELFCILTCYLRAQAIENDSHTSVHEADVEWMENINLWATTHKVLAKNAKGTMTYWKRYGFALYHNVSSTMFKRAQATYTNLYTLSAAEKNIGLVLNLSSYLLGKSQIQGDMHVELGKEDRDLIVTALFGGKEDVVAGLKMVQGFYTRDYKSIECSKERKHYKDEGSFPTGQYSPPPTFYI
jgi:hypothetical protein